MFDFKIFEDLKNEYVESIFTLCYENMICSTGQECFIEKFGRHKKVNFVRLANALYNKGYIKEYEKYVHLVLNRCKDQFSLFVFRRLASKMEGHYKNVRIYNCEQKNIIINDGGVYIFIRGKNEIDIIHNNVLVISLAATNQLPFRNVPDEYCYFPLKEIPNKCCDRVYFMYKRKMDAVENKFDYEGDFIGSNELRSILNYNFKSEGFIFYYDYTPKKYTADMRPVVKRVNRTNAFSICDNISDDFSVVRCGGIFKERRYRDENYWADNDILRNRAFRTGEDVIVIEGNNGIHELYSSRNYIITGSDNAIYVKGKHPEIFVTGNNNKIIADKESIKNVSISINARNNIVSSVDTEK